jgi:hypothetical protein
MTDRSRRRGAPASTALRRWLCAGCAEALSSRIGQISPLPVNHVGMRVEDMDAAIAWYRAVLGFDLIEGPVQARVRPRRPIHRRKVLG